MEPPTRRAFTSRLGITFSIAELADEYSEDPGRESYPTGYTFTTGSMVQEFEDAAYALSEGEVSEVVESSLGPLWNHLFKNSAVCPHALQGR